MKKITIAVMLSFLCSGFAVFAQDDEYDSVEEMDSLEVSSNRDSAMVAKKRAKWFVGAHGGINMVTSENAFAYFDSGNGGKLINGQGFINVGYYFHPKLGVRGTIEYSGNCSAANYKEANYVFHPYTFSSILGFVDLVINGGKMDVPKPFNWRFFLGVGVSGSFGFSKTSWPYPETPTGYELNAVDATCFAFRYGLILEYIWKCGLGLAFELNHEWMTDEYNGMKVPESFPFDTKFNLSLGLNYHF